MTEIEYFCSWSRVIDFDVLHKALNEIKKLNIRELCPTYKNIFKVFELCGYDNLKAVVLGQSPYPQKRVATGVAFANTNGIKDISPSLRVLLRASRGYEGGDLSLSDWCRQGILPLNSSLTTMTGKTEGHGWIWRDFIASLLHGISVGNRGIPFILLGTAAQSFERHIYKEGNFILKDKHPAYYARTGEDMPTYVFDRTRQLLKDYINFEIIW